LVSDNDDDLKCDVSGLAATDDDLATVDPGDDLELPVGWIALTVTRRRPNPAYLRAMQAQEMEVQGGLAQIPEDTSAADRASAEGLLRESTRARYFPMMQSAEYAPTLEEAATRMFLAPELAAPRGVQGMDGICEYLTATFKLPAELLSAPKARKRAPRA